MKKRLILGRGGAFLVAQGLLIGAAFSANAAELPASYPSSNLTLLVDQRADITIRGTVKDEKNQPLPGATITVLGTSRGTVTDIDGKFTITAPENGQLVFSYLGFKAQTIDVNARSIVDVILAEELSSLNEFVVTSFGMAKEQKSLGYATTTIKADELIKAGTPNVATALYGKAPGVRYPSRCRWGYICSKYYRPRYQLDHWSKPALDHFGRGAYPKRRSAKQ